MTRTTLVAETSYSVPRMPATPLGVLISYLESWAIFRTMPMTLPDLRSSWVSITVSIPVDSKFSLSMPSVVFSTNRTTGPFWSMNKSTWESLAVRIVDPGLSTWPTFNGSHCPASAYCADPRTLRTTALPTSTACAEVTTNAPTSATAHAVTAEKDPRCFIKVAPGLSVVTKSCGQFRYLQLNVKRNNLRAISARFYPR